MMQQPFDQGERRSASTTTADTSPAVVKLHTACSQILDQTSLLRACQRETPALQAGMFWPGPGHPSQSRPFIDSLIIRLSAAPAAEPD